MVGHILSSFLSAISAESLYPKHSLVIELRIADGKRTAHTLLIQSNMLQRFRALRRNPGIIFYQALVIRQLVHLRICPLGRRNTPHPAGGLVGLQGLEPGTNRL